MSDERTCQVCGEVAGAGFCGTCGHDADGVHRAEAERDRLQGAATKALHALQDWRNGYGDPANRDALIDEAGVALHEALAP